MTSSQQSSTDLSVFEISEHDLQSLSAEEQEFLLSRLKAEQSKRQSTNRLAYYRPYPKQHEFHCAGAQPVYERLFMAGNQLGKTWAGAFEVALHLTGRYDLYRGPNGEAWEGRRLDKPVTWLAGSESSELTRDGVQRLLIGSPSDESAWGTGAIPKEALLDWNRKQGVPNALDSVTVRHVAGTSTLLFKSYDQGRGKWQANTVDGVWFDEEPPFDVYSEGRTRTTATQGIVLVTFTPLRGISQVVKRYLNEPSEHRKVVVMTIRDAEHISPEDRERIIAGYPAHEREARANGVPTMGAGAVFPIADEEITCDPIPIPVWWRRLGGIDFGWDHPTGAVEIVHDPEHDIVYIVREYRQKRKTAQEHAMTLLGWGEDLPWAWPHDGLQHDKGAGGQIRKQYRDARLKMLPEHATFPDGTNSVEAGNFFMLERMQTGRLKVFRTCPLWLEEKRLYHREETADGGSKLVKIDDDLLSASRYAIMMLRKARIVEARTRFGVPVRGGEPRVAEGTGEVW